MKQLRCQNMYLDVLKISGIENILFTKENLSIYKADFMFATISKHFIGESSHLTE